MCSLCALCVGSGPVKTGAVGSAQFAFIGQLCHIVASVGGITGTISSQRPVAQYHYGHFPQSMACGLVPCWEKMAKTMGSQWFNVDPNSLLAFVCVFFYGLSYSMECGSCTGIAQLSQGTIIDLRLSNLVGMYM
jgi:hypothetical protein